LVLGLLSMFLIVDAYAEENVQNLSKDTPAMIPYINIIIGFLVFIAAGCSAYAAFKANRVAQNSILKELVSDYAEPEIGNAVKTLWHYYRNVFNEDAKKFTEKFKTYMEKSIETGKNIDRARRKVSHFYQCMAMLHEGDAIPEKLLYRLWSKKTLQIIPDILIPLEKVLFELRNEKVEEKDFKLLINLYEDSKKYH
jgi:uncharacterized protein YxeA